jgi:hypothetical protein
MQRCRAGFLFVKKGERYFYKVSKREFQNEKNVNRTSDAGSSSAK